MPGSTFGVRLNGGTVGTEYDQLAVAGTVDLGDATLSLTLGYTPAVGDSFTIIDNDGTDDVVGTSSGYRKARPSRSASSPSGSATRAGPGMTSSSTRSR